MERRMLSVVTFFACCWLAIETTFLLMSSSQSFWSMLFWYFVIPSFGAFGFLALAELAWERWEMVKGEFVEPRAWLAPVTVGLSAFALRLALFGWEAP